MKQSKTTKQVVIFYVKHTNYYHFKLDFQKVGQHTGGMWLIHGTKRRKDNQLQSLALPVEYPSRERYIARECLMKSQFDFGFLINDHLVLKRFLVVYD